MRSCRPGGRAFTRRLSHAVSLFSIALLTATASAADFAGTVVDPQGRPLPRVRVRVILDSGGAATDARTDVFTDQAGRFRLSSSSDCRIEASLAGFRTASVPCTSSGTLTIQLPLAPVEETVVVTATRSEAPSSQVGVGVTSFTAAEIERRQTSLVSDLLRTSPGAMVMPTGAPGGVTGLFVRGGESTYNAVLVDGIPLNEPGGTFNFNNLTTENLERIEIVRGANSALFGSDAMSSVVQLFTRRGASATPSIAAQIDGGTYGTVHASASASGTTHGVDYSVGAARLSTDNRVPNSSFDNTSLSASVGVRVGPDATLRGILRGEHGTTGTPGQTVYGRPDLDAFYEHDDVVGGIALDQQLTPRLHQRASYSLSASTQASTNLLEDPPYTPAFDGHVAPYEYYDFVFDSQTRLRRHYASYQADWLVGSGARGGDHRLTALVDWHGERARLADRLGGDPVKASRDNIGTSIQHQMLWRRLSTTAGARVERNASFGTAVVPRVSAVVTLHEGAGQVGDTRVRGAAGLGIKEPTVLQSFSISPYFTGNPDLEPERSRAVEIAVEQRLAGDRVKVDATWFDNRYRNIIGLRSTGGFNSEYFNIGVTRARGLELGTDLVPHNSVRVRAGYSFVDSAIVESTSAFSPVFAVGQWAFRRPRHSGYVQGTWSWSRVTADLTGTMIGRYVDSDFSSLDPPIVENPGRTTWDTRVSYRVTSKVTGLFAVDNLTGRNYQEPLGYLALERAIRIGARVRF